MNKNDKPNFTYDPNLKPFHESEVKYNNKTVLLYDLDEHCNNLFLSKAAFMTEYFTDKNECIIIPKFLAEKLMFVDDNILDMYLKTQQFARDKIERTNVTISVITLIFIGVVVVTILGIFKIDPLFLSIPYALLILINKFYYKNHILSKAYKNFVFALGRKFDKDTITSNLDECIGFVKNEMSYMGDKQKQRTIKHFIKLQKMLQKSL